MSTYSDFAQKMLLGLYQEVELFEAESVTLGDLVRTYQLDAKERWLQMLVEEWHHSSLVDVDDVLGPPATKSVYITAAGVRQIERDYGSKDGVGQILQRFGAEKRLIAPGVESTAWTGRAPSITTLNSEAAVKLVRELDKAEAALLSLDLGQEAKAQVRAYIVSARTLAESPEPQADLIWELLNRANAMAGVASLFVSILALIVAK